MSWQNYSLCMKPRIYICALIELSSIHQVEIDDLKVKNEILEEQGMLVTDSFVQKCNDLFQLTSHARGLFALSCKAVM